MELTDSRLTSLIEDILDGAPAPDPVFDELLGEVATPTQDGPLPIVEKKKRVRAPRKKILDPISADEESHANQVLKKPRPYDYPELPKKDLLWDGISLGHDVVSRLWPKTMKYIIEGKDCHLGTTCPCGVSARDIMMQAITDPDDLRKHRVLHGIEGLRSALDRERVLRSITAEHEVLSGYLMRSCSLCELFPDMSSSSKT